MYLFNTDADCVGAKYFKVFVYVHGRQHAYFGYSYCAECLQSCIYLPGWNFSRHNPLQCSRPTCQPRIFNLLFRRHRRGNANYAVLRRTKGILAASSLCDCKSNSAVHLVWVRVLLCLRRSHRPSHHVDAPDLVTLYYCSQSCVLSEPNLRLLDLY